MAKIVNIWSREILDSRGMPTVETACQLDSGIISVASVPSGASRAKHEALELRDEDKARYHGRGVLKAVQNVNKIIAPKLVQAGIEPTEQRGVDEFLIKLDGTETRSNLGANAMLSVSICVLKAAASSRGLSVYSWVNRLSGQFGLQAQVKVPTPIFNMINGGLHGAGNLDFQEFFVIPASTKSFIDGLRAGVEVYMMIGESLARRGAIHSVGDEGGYAPNLFTNADALEILVEGARQTDYQIGRDLFLGLDVAANTFYENGSYTIRDKSTSLNEDGMIEYFKELNDLYHLAILEDPLHEDAWGGWQKLSQALGEQLRIVGDDLLSTNPKRVDKAIRTKACNSILVKPNQNGTISETMDVIKKSRMAGWKVITSHRSGETNDTFIADFAVGVGSDYVKFGAPARGERVAKYNRLSAIAAELSLRQISG